MAAIGVAIDEPSLLTISVVVMIVAPILLISIYCHLPGPSFGDALRQLCAPRIKWASIPLVPATFVAAAIWGCGAPSGSVPVTTDTHNHAKAVQPVAPKLQAPAALHWRLGAIDPRFNLTTAEVREAVTRATNVWNQAGCRQLFRNDDSDGFPISFVYDERQAKMNSDKAAKQNIAAYKQKLADSRLKLQAADEELQSAKDHLEHEDRDHAGRVDQYNDRVNIVNAAGGATEELARSLDEEKSDLAAEKASLDTEAEKANQLLESRNELADEHNQLVQAYNAVVTAYNANLGQDNEELGVCERVDGRAKQIEVFAFKDMDDLERTLAHELGHAIGLQHVKGDGSIMSAVRRAKDPTTLELTDADKSELRRALPKL